jgi:serine/threonine-protein kinase
MDDQHAPMDLPAVGDEIAGKYRIEGVLGQGGMGIVLFARNKLTGKRVAIKWLLPEQSTDTSRERLLREAQIAASIEHPNVVDIYDVGEHQGGLFLVMEYLPGRSLADVLALEGRLDADTLIGWMIPAMRGVHAAHAAGVIHRDLKPENIILSEMDERVIPKVVDFGVSKATSRSAIPNSSLTRTGALVGTPHYMALEQVDGTNAIDARTDVYAFGVILYRALTGHLPFDGSSLGEVILKIGTRDPSPLRMYRPDLPDALDLVVRRAMSRSRQARHKDVAELAVALEPYAPGVRFRESSDVLRLPSLSTSRSLLNAIAASAQGVTPYPGHYPLEPVAANVASAPPFDTHKSQPPAVEIASSTPVGGVGMRDTPMERVPSQGLKTLWIAAVFVCAGLFGLAGWWSMRSRPGPPMPPDAPIPAAIAAPVVQPPLSAPNAPSPGDSAPPSAVDFVPDTPIKPLTPSAIAAPSAPPSTIETEPSTVVPERGGKGSKPVARAAKDKGASEPKLIPGDRTKGLSADDF